jgi:hypothetical protein
MSATKRRQEPEMTRNDETRRATLSTGAAGSLCAVALLVAVAGCPSSEPGAVAPSLDIPDALAKEGVADAAARGPDTPPPPQTKADKLRARLATCAKQVSTGLFKTDDEGALPAEIPICELGAAVFWKADMDIDCDGKVTAKCSGKTDPAFQPDTALRSSTGQPLDASTLPYVVIPSVSQRFDYEAAGIVLGSVVMVVYGDKVEFGVFGDTGPEAIIGEASYAMAERLGIDPDPKTGGTTGGDKEVLYVAFKGAGAVIKKAEDHAAAVTLGEAQMNAAFPGL